MGFPEVTLPAIPLGDLVIMGGLLVISVLCLVLGSLWIGRSSAE